MRHHRKAFTLVELLVVMAIVAILAAILFPVFASAREKARQVTCLSNARQVGFGILQYAGDHDGVMPIWYRASINWGRPSLGRVGWAQAVDPWLRSLQVYACPSDPYGMAIGYVGNTPTLTSVDDRFHFGRYDYRPEQAADPTSAPLVFDRNPLDEEGADKNTLNADPTNETQINVPRERSHPASLRFPGRHRGFNNLVFLDGHAKAWRDVPGGGWPGEYLRRWR